MMQAMSKGRNKIIVFLLLYLSSVAPIAQATDIDGVQPAALDQPRVNVLLRRDPKGKPLVTAGGKDSDVGAKVFNVEAFLDTGASGFVLSSNTAKALGIRRETVGNVQGADPVVFEDVGVGGTDEFHVSEPLHAMLAPFHPGTDTDNVETLDDYRTPVGPLRAQVGPINAGGLGIMEMVLGNLDIVGMPAMKGKVVVLDPKPLNTFGDTMRTYVYAPGAKFNLPESHRNPGIPKTDRHVRLTYVSFAPFTKLKPRDATGPTLAPNPFLGPSPLGARAGEKAAPPVVLVHKGKRQNVGMLLDTGAAASFISTKHAETLGITYASGGGSLRGVPADKQFTLTVGGIGGQKKRSGFFLDEMRVPTTENDELIYRGAPVLVLDITVKDVQGKEVTLDGVFGMNFLVASANITEGLLPDIGKLTEGPFEWIVFDEPKALLGLKLRK